MLLLDLRRRNARRSAGAAALSVLFPGMPMTNGGEYTTRPLVAESGQSGQLRNRRLTGIRFLRPFGATEKAKPHDGSRGFAG